jgi:threonine aldolase
VCRPLIDLRSDTVTRPTDAMRRAMAAAEVGDDVFGDDPTVRRLEDEVAAAVGKEAGVFVPSGTQSNLSALLTHCARGDEYVVGQSYHCYRYEAGGAAVLGSIQPQPIEVEPDGSLDLARVAAVVKPADPHFARTRLLCLEDTTDGRVLDAGYLTAAAATARAHGLAVHLDGARLFNAAAALGVPAAVLTAPVDSVSVCLSKGLGAPVGSVLCGPGAFVTEARRWRKMLGGAMRQVGVLAAAGLVAVRDHRHRLADDHDTARRLAEGLAASEVVELLHPPGARTNMVFVQARHGVCGVALADHLARHRVLVHGTGPGFRFVTHLDVGPDDVDAACAAIASFPL